MLFFMALIIGTMISISSYSWFAMWIGLEINLLSIIPLFKSSNNSFPTESTIKYFITQVLASTVILFAIIMSMNLNEFIPQNSNYWMMIMMNSAFLTKMGAAPFHTWFPEVAEGLNWMNNLLLLTWQKLAPMILIMYNLEMTLFLSIIIILCSIISGILGFNQVSLRKIMAYSSINHIGWMLASMLNFKMIWILYFMVYSVITMNIILMFYLLNTFFIPQLFLTMNSNKLIKMLFIFNFFSLGGLPPFLGFLPKWLTINFLIENGFNALSLILILFTLITLYFYIRITISTLTIYVKETIISTNKIKNFILISFNAITLSSIILSTNLFNFL
uniref:NADH-ubiquinone oxidoreductase chain 2 n=1 Tax=Sphaeroderma rubidum TaxID=878991 RepID=A0A3G1GR90_9CUCU|nr:NADH dehydrogenase subunit 2 [Sphaeroderma rubidum]